MIEDVEKLGPELETDSFSNHGSFKHREIEVIDTGSAKGWIYASLIAEAPIWRRCKARRVEEQLRAGSNVAANLSAAVCIATGYNVRTYVRNAQVVAFQRGRTRISDFEREALLESGYAIDSPPGHYLVCGAVESGEKWLAVAEWKVKNIADGYPL